MARKSAAASDKESREAILRELRKHRGSLPADFKFNREEANARIKRARVSRWGNSLAVRLPASMVAALELKPGDEIELTSTGARSLGLARPLTVKERLDALERFRGRAPMDFKFDRIEASKR